VTGTINPSTKVLTGTGTIRDGCGSIAMTGTFTSDFDLYLEAITTARAGVGRSLAASNPKYQYQKGQSCLLMMGDCKSTDVVNITTFP
jgi:hypothetical protein